MEFQKFVKLDNYLRMYAGGHIDERYYFLRNATEEQQKDLLAMITYLRANNVDKQKISFSVMHDIFGINQGDDMFFIPYSASYSKGDPCVVSFKESK